MSENTIVEAASAIDEALDTVSKQKVQIADLTATIERLRNRSNQYGKDISKLNEFMNTYADENSLCDTYENTLAEWNSEFVLISLVGRERTFTVNTRVEMTFEVNVEVQAKNSDEAMEKVGEMYVSDIIEENSMDITDYDDYTVEPRSASVEN